MKTNLKVFSVKIDTESVGQRLDRFLASHPEIHSRSFAQDLIEKKMVSVDSKQVRASFLVQLNQTVEVTLPETSKAEDLMPLSLRLDIVFEDVDVIVVNKPSGLVVHPAAGHKTDTLVNALVHHTSQLSMKNEQRPGIVHRIDKETSGLLVIAKNDLAHENLAAQFRQKTVHRVYFALVKGAVIPLRGTIKSYLARHPKDRKRYASVRIKNQIIREFTPDFQQGKWAVTHYERLAQIGGTSYMRIQLDTGRTHQIRVHMSEKGHPLIGDTQYGFSLQKAKAENLNRFFLHAAELGFCHPRTKEEMLFKVDWPEIDLQALRNFGYTK